MRILVYCRRMETKHCPDCDRDLPLDDFYRAPKGALGRQRRCKPCHVAHTGNYYAGLSPERKARRIAQIKAKKYGMTLEQMQALVAAHDDNCDLCGKPDTTHRKRTWTRQLTLDHDHVTGRYRGLICSECNLALGHTKDDPALLRRMADYVERFR
jgi:hypothetical protein